MDTCNSLWERLYYWKNGAGETGYTWWGQEKGQGKKERNWFSFSCQRKKLIPDD